MASPKKVNCTMPLGRATLWQQSELRQNASQFGACRNADAKKRRRWQDKVGHAFLGRELTEFNGVSLRHKLSFGFAAGKSKSMTLVQSCPTSLPICSLPRGHRVNEEGAIPFKPGKGMIPPKWRSCAIYRLATFSPKSSPFQDERPTSWSDPATERPSDRANERGTSPGQSGEPSWSRNCKERFLSSAGILKC